MERTDRTKESRNTDRTKESRHTDKIKRNEMHIEYLQENRKIKMEIFLREIKIYKKMKVEFIKVKYKQRKRREHVKMSRREGD